MGVPFFLEEGKPTSLDWGQVTEEAGKSAIRTHSLAGYCKVADSAGAAGNDRTLASVQNPLFMALPGFSLVILYLAIISTACGPQPVAYITDPLSLKITFRESRKAAMDKYVIYKSARQLIVAHHFDRIENTSVQ